MFSTKFELNNIKRYDLVKKKKERRSSIFWNQSVRKEVGENMLTVNLNDLNVCVYVCCFFFHLFILLEMYIKFQFRIFCHCCYLFLYLFLFNFYILLAFEIKYVFIWVRIDDAPLRSHFESFRQWTARMARNEFLKIANRVKERK